MKFNENEEAILSTGKTFSANCKIIGICEELEISEGYDGGLNSQKFTKEEKREIALYMIDLWIKWVEKNED